MRVLRADGQRIDLTSRDAGAALVATRQDWQKVGHSYRDLIPELRIAHQLLGRSVARVRFYVAEQRSFPQDPAPLEAEDPEHGLDSQLAADAIHNFNLLPLDTNPDGFTARLTENLAIAGEVWIHWDENDRFHVRSTSEVTATADGRVVISSLPNATAASQHPVNPETEELLRLWRPHPEWGSLADSPLKALLDVCEDAVLAGREQRAAARSRVAANGLLLIPESLSLLTQREDEDGDDITEDRFMADLTEGMLAPIRDDGDASAVVPLVLQGASEDLDKVRHMTLQREDSDKVIDKQKAAVDRILKSIDIQIEQVEGYGDVNHWGAWQIEATSLKNQVQPNAEALAACLVQAFLKPALLSLGHAEADVDKVTIAVDISALSENPNRGQDARDAHDRSAISDAALRAALGFEEDDAPSDDEIIRRLAAKGNLPVGVIATLFGLSQQEVTQAATIEGTIADATEDPNAPKALPPGPSRPSPAPGDTVPPNPIPEPSGPITAAAVVDDGWRVDVDVSRRLADIDAAFAEWLLTEADAALARVLERAGARVRSAAQKDKSLSASVAGVEAHLVPTRLGRERTAELANMDELFADAYGRLRSKFFTRLADAAAQIGEVLVELLGLGRKSERAQQVRDQTVRVLEKNSEPAWQVLTERLDEAAERAAFEPDPFNPQPDARGEVTNTIIRPAEVNQVLNVAGGGTVHRSPMRNTTPGPGGYGTGPDVSALLDEHGAVLLGWEWQYRHEIPRGSNFHPHERLDKVRFATFTDPKLDTDAGTAWIGPYFHPGDHDGDRCRVAPVLATPELIPDDESNPAGESIVERRLREARESVAGQAAARVAADDTAAGRVGTSVQQEVEVRDRITADVRRLRARHIDGAS
jgi:hypothetical protein